MLFNILLKINILYALAFLNFNKKLSIFLIYFYNFKYYEFNFQKLITTEVKEFLKLS